MVIICDLAPLSSVECLTFCFLYFLTIICSISLIESGYMFFQLLSMNCFDIYDSKDLASLLSLGH